MAAWLTINSMRSERIQFNLLCEQQIQHVWRRRGYQALMKDFAPRGSTVSAVIEERPVNV